jgi:transcriptional regulator
VHGSLAPLPAGEETLEVVKATVRAFEKGFGADWDMAGSIDYFRKIVPAVGAFRFTVTRAEGMFKLSQEQQPEIRERVRSAFAERPYGRHREIAEMMGRLPCPGHPATARNDICSVGDASENPDAVAHHH